MSFDEIWAVISVIGAIAGIALIVYLQARPGEYEADDRAREYFDRTGRWPDEDQPPGSSGPS